MNTIIFCRVSTADQSLSRQIEELTDFAKSQDWNVVKVVTEIGSGTTAIERRKAIDDLKRSVIELEADKILVSEISRLGRTTSESLSVIDFMTRNGVSCYEFQRRLETLNADLTVNPIAELILSVLASVAKMEKAQLVERIKSGMKSAARKGKHLGRAKGTVKAPETFLQENKAVVRSLTEERLSVRKTARLYNVSVATVQKAKKLLTVHGCLANHAKENRLCA